MNATPTRKVDAIDDYHGTLVTDPYRWLEDADDPEVRAWTEAQNARTRAVLDALPERERIRQRLTELWDYPKYSIPTKEGDETATGDGRSDGNGRPGGASPTVRYFFSKNEGLQNQPVIYVQEAEAHEAVGQGTNQGRHEARPLLDPNRLSANGTVAVTSYVPSKDARYLGYALAESGSDWQTLRVREVGTGDDLADMIRWCKFTRIAWTHDHSGFFYSRFPEPGSVPPEDQNNYNRVYWHALGTAQADDRLVYERPDFKELHFTPEVSHDGRYLVITASVGTDPRTRIYYRDVERDGPLVPLLDEGDARYWFIDNDGPVFYVQTDLDGPRGRVVAIDTRQPQRDHWHEVIPEGDDPLAFVVAADERFVVVTLRDAKHHVALFHRDGAFDREIRLPAMGSVEAVSGKPGDPELFVQFTSFLYPSTPFRYDLDDPNAALVPLHASAIDFDPSDYETTQVFSASKDGTRVPMFVTRRRGLPLDGNNPTLLYGYGGCYVALTTAFAIHRLIWLEAGGVFALANLRGGEEYGEAWHQAGMLERKQNVFDDFIAAAEWLIENGYTRPQKLAINGGSNRGLLVAACMTQRPELFGAVVCEVPVIDMLRYHRFTVGHFWVPEYGNAEADSEHFRFLYAYSPLHNVRSGTAYPPTLITSADTDDRVVPAHAKKFFVTLAEAQGSDDSVLLRVELKAGHGLGKPTGKIIEERADVYAFLFDVLGVKS